MGRAITSLSENLTVALDRIAASEVFVYRRAAGGRFTLVGHRGRVVAPAEFFLDDEPLAAQAVERGCRRLASYDRRRIVSTYRARSAALISTSADVLVVIGRHDGCMAGCDDRDLYDAARVAVATLA